MLIAVSCGQTLVGCWFEPEESFKFLGFMTAIPYPQNSFF